jgi:hypothetical protein
MNILMDKTLRDFIEDIHEWDHLGRTDEFRHQKAVFAEILCDLESSGYAMRHLDSKGQIAWRATPDLRSYLNDLRLDAEAEMEDEEV